MSRVSMGWRQPRRLGLGLALLGLLPFAGCIEEDPAYVPLGTGGDDAAATSQSTSPVTGTGEPTSGSSEGSTGSLGESTGGGSRGDSTGADDGASSTGDGCTDEVCDGLDNDCDDEVDEVCECVVGSAPQPCYSGDPGTQNVGVCVDGTRSCEDDGTLNPVCEDEVLPSVELCNNADDDCDGGVDEDFGQVTCGTGICQVTIEECVDGVPQDCVPGDPDPMESCNGLDDTCEGEVDEGCMCLDGEMQDCYTGPAGTQGIGLCAEGSQTCVDGAWGACENDVTPQPELCNGLDDSCDGVEDDGDPEGGSACQTGLAGVCGPGIEECIDGSLECTQVTFPTTEECNGLDDDCDTGVDEGDPGGGDACSTGLQGVCDNGTTQCQSGAIQCIQTTFASPESCNGLDDDCDGAADESNPESGQACSTGNPGICDAGLTDCQAGSLQCVQLNMPSAETCNGLDDDCDASTDENNPDGGVMCNTGLPGICADGSTDCQMGSLECVQLNTATTETCNGLDDDCDGTADDGDPGGGAACNTGMSGVCGPGTTACEMGGIVCNANTTASAEVCDGLDNDCDGADDEGNPGGGAACNTGLQGVCAAGLTDCQAGNLECVQQTGASSDVCDGLDNDCDGTVDEGNPGGGQACNTGLQGVCSAGLTDCQAGNLECLQLTGASAEVCDGLDNDCDGTDDEGNPGGGSSCSTGQPGECDAGTTQCSGGGLVCNANNTPQAEQCDGLDNDCDNATDEGNPGGGVACNTGLLGVCAAGTTQCVSASVDCVQDTPAQPEICGDAQDNDCNGTVDNGCCSQTVSDGDFEAGTPSVIWTEASINFGSPLCTTAVCSTGGGSGPHGGTWWAWFGGFDGYELATLTQSITIPVGIGTMTYWLEIPACASAGLDTFVINLDGVQVAYHDNSDSTCDTIGYAQYAIDVSGFADGGVHTLELVGEVFGIGLFDSITNFFIDDVSLVSCI